MFIRGCDEIAPSEYWKWLPMKMLRYITVLKVLYNSLPE